MLLLIGPSRHRSNIIYNWQVPFSAMMLRRLINSIPCQNKSNGLPRKILVLFVFSAASSPSSGDFPLFSYYWPGQQLSNSGPSSFSSNYFAAANFVTRKKFHRGNNISIGTIPCAGQEHTRSERGRKFVSEMMPFRIKLSFKSFLLLVQLSTFHPRIRPLVVCWSCCCC